ncbi:MULTISPECIES: DUF536 domain-containing protein [Vagococcus]|uniref:Transcriptional regulator OrfX n=1 Tax=Vagococcus fluvialis bH819 TaxID=1255619 RepID=A0A1X6WP50_9ENTE|nr:MULTISPECIES: DUF536 domain-containing protein [Vagococcus]NLM68140.1 DUF536 domain-containing protein [Enterococcus sp.]MDT2816212.1 DUF536 domain-containing protein [Vagococcus carniphilus]MDT2832346.1 DUF536 domain-containing protein [Vagococcus carniphilus]MDT2841010.1 DUF536 domain-containing protein [Vagococcus carniphilus]SLM86002.1 Transcriptional regulator OrfX [Vagococcus fluvialis bH819]
MKNQSYMTIKELADELNVSKTAINKKIDETFKEKYVTKNGNRFVIDVSGQKVIKSMFKEVNANQERKPNQEPVFDLVCVLKENLERTEEQLKVKDNQIEALQKLLDQQQVLTLQANQKIEQLEMNQAESEEKEKLSFWQRLFGK